MVSVTSSVARTWKAGETDNIALLVKTKRPDGLALTRQAVQRMAPLFDEEVLQASLTVHDTPKGPGVFIDSCDDLDPVLHHLGSALADVGLDDAVITVLPAAPWRGARGVSFPCGYIRALVVLDAAPEGESWWGPVWRPEAGVLEQVADWMLDYCLALSGVSHLEVYAAGRDIALDPEGARPFLRSQATRRVGEDLPIAVCETRADDGRFRRANLDLQTARIAMSSGVDDHPYDWQANLAVQLELLAQLPDYVQSAVLSSGQTSLGLETPRLHSDALNEESIDRIPYDSSERRHLEARQMLDAYGVMLMRGAVRRYPADPSPWDITDTTTSLLLQWNDAEAWFGADALDSELLLRARRSLGNAIAWNG